MRAERKKRGEKGVGTEGGREEGNNFEDTHLSL